MVKRVLNRHEIGGKTALTWAAGWGHQSCVCILVSAGADVNLMEEGEEGRRGTPLSWAVSQGRVPVVEYLLDHGAHIASAGDRPLLGLAASSGNVKLLRDLCVWAEESSLALHLDEVDRKGKTPFLLAAAKGHVEMMEALYDFGASVSYRDFEDNTALLLAAGWGHCEAVHWLLDKANLSINETNRWGDTALHRAAHFQREMVVEYLLRKDADAYKRNKNGHRYCDLREGTRKPEIGETGPYYVKGELVRQNVRESEPAVPIVIEGQFIDVETCEPITDLYWDLWNCNSTGVYSGLIAQGNGNTADTSNLDASFLRGIQMTYDDGIVKFLSIFPGHYDGRTTHHHMVAWLNATVLPNNTLTSGYARHIGQLFWDQDLIYAVEATYPYNTNDIEITTNAGDRVVVSEVSDTDSDPFFDYVYLGDELSDGLFGWVTIGINKSATYAPNFSFTYGEDGGTALSTRVGSENVDGANASGMMATGTGIASGMPSGMSSFGKNTNVSSIGANSSTGVVSAITTATMNSESGRMSIPFSH